MKKALDREEILRERMKTKEEKEEKAKLDKKEALSSRCWRRSAW